MGQENNKTTTTNYPSATLPNIWGLKESSISSNAFVFCLDDMLCYAALCCAMLCHAMICYAGYIVTYISTNIDIYTLIHTYISTFTDTCRHIYIHIHIHISIHIHICTKTYAHACALTQIVFS